MGPSPLKAAAHDDKPMRWYSETLLGGLRRGRLRCHLDVSCLARLQNFHLRGIYSNRSRVRTRGEIRHRNYRLLLRYQPEQLLAMGL